MRDMINIIFDNKIFPGRYMYFDFGTRLVSIHSLNLLLFIDGDYPNEIARRIDERIFYFVEDSEILKDEQYLVDKIVSEL